MADGLSIEDYCLYIRPYCRADSMRSAKPLGAGVAFSDRPPATRTLFNQHDVLPLRFMLHSALQMRHVTISLDDATFRWARFCAEREHLSVTSYIEQLIEQTRSHEDDYLSAMQRALQFRPFPLNSDSPFLVRTEIYGRPENQ